MPIVRRPVRALWDAVRLSFGVKCGKVLFDRILKMPTYFNKCLTVLSLHYDEAMQLLFLFFFLLLCKNCS